MTWDGSLTDGPYSIGLGNVYLIDITWGILNYCAMLMLLYVVAVTLYSETQAQLASIVNIGNH